MEGFYVRVRSAAQGSKAPPITKMIYGSASTYHIITKLHPYTQYSVTIIPFYHRLSGRPSKIMSARTHQDGTCSAAQHIELPLQLDQRFLNYLVML